MSNPKQLVKHLHVCYAGSDYADVYHMRVTRENFIELFDIPDDSIEMVDKVIDPTNNVWFSRLTSLTGNRVYIFITPEEAKDVQS